MDLPPDEELDVLELEEGDLWYQATIFSVYFFSDALKKSNPAAEANIRGKCSAWYYDCW